MDSRRLIIRQLLSSRASSTVKTYVAQYRKFIQFVLDHRKLTRALPFCSTVISQYLTHLLLTKKTHNVILQAYCALKWIHDLLPLDTNPADTAMIKNIVEASKRLHSKPSSRKEPLSIQSLEAIVSRFAAADSDLKDIRTALLFVLGFSGLFRANELINIQAKHITFHSDHLVILVPQSKTDQYREGNNVFISKTNGRICPHNLLLRYFSLADIAPKSEEYVFRSIQAPRKGSKHASLGPRRLSYTRCRELVKEGVRSIGLDPKIYSTHSLRAGGATFMAHSQASNPNLNRLLKIQGRWRSDSSKDIYIKDTLQDRLTLTQSLKS